MKLSDWFSIQPYGECRHLADLLGVDQSTVRQWANGTQPIPIAHCKAIERATDWKVRPWDLRDDVTWLVVGDRLFVEVD